MSNASDFVINNGVLEKYVGPGGDVVIPDGVTSIGKEAFLRCRDLTGVELPESVTVIDEAAFFGCGNLAKITMPRVKSIRDFAFSGCYSLESVNLPNSLERIGDWAFRNSGLKSASLPNTTKSVGSGAFKWCEDLEEISMPSVTSIGDSAFFDCAKLTSVTIPESATSIGSEAFKECKSLFYVTLPQSLRSIGKNAFEIFCEIKMSDGSDPAESSLPDEVIRELELEKQFEVNGTHLGGRGARIENVNVGDSLQLIREPDNKYDSNAIGVYNNSGSLGFVPANLSKKIAPLIDSGKIICSATVVDVVPRSKRGKGARASILNIRLNAKVL